MKITISFGGKTHDVEPTVGPFAPVKGVACPGCKKPELHVKGKGMHIESHDTYAAEGYAACCGAYLGPIRAKVNTIFGIEEDQRVLNGRARVY